MLLRESQTVPLPSIRLPAPVVPAFDLVSDGLVNCATFHCRHFLQSGRPCRDAAIDAFAFAAIIAETTGLVCEQR
jgi:hypothetical protein